MKDEFLLQEYLREKQKEKHLDEFSIEAKSLLAKAVMAISLSEDIDQTKISDSHNRILKLLIKSRNQKLILPELKRVYDTNRKNAIKELKKIESQILNKIFGGNFDQYNYLKSQKTEKDKAILDSYIQRCFIKTKHKELLVKYNIVQDIIGSIRKPIVVLKQELLSVVIDKDKDYILNAIASIIDNPILLSYRNIELENEWSDFPLKWFGYKLTIQELRTLFKQHKLGNSLEKYIFTYIDKRLDDIEIKLENHIYPYLAERDSILKEIIFTYKNKAFSSCLNTVLPLIEGILWGFAYFYNHNGGNLYCNEDGKTLLVFKNGNKAKDFTIGDLLKKTSLGDLFDSNFISYYCDELYKERNPILHGQDISFFSDFNCAKKIMTFDYITDIINDFIKKEQFKKMDNIFGRIVVEKVIEGKKLTKKEKIMIEDKVKSIKKQDSQ